ncbi:uncharacterized protein PAC_04496 [Phialocephala subalpina]|uniref:Uncharacterized protein n=1 Tax=Phialocephala subalpina TaxID=576137 RepID=A0A1L7WPD0_9HELO|nr:uncharacterized protein PAC_04496 [Phialocephala subalpina]
MDKMERPQSYDSAVAPANARPEYVIFNSRAYTNGAMHPFDVVTVVAREEGEVTDQNPGYVVLGLVVYYRCGGLDPARIVNDPRTQIVVAAPRQIDYTPPITEITSIPAGRPRDGCSPAVQLGQDPYFEGGHDEGGGADDEDSDEEEDGQEEDGLENLGWLPLHHHYLFNEVIEPFLRRSRRRPKTHEYQDFANDVYRTFQHIQVYKGDLFMSPVGKPRKSRRTFDFLYRPLNNINCYVNRTWKAKFEVLCVRILGPGGGKKKPKYLPNPNRDQRKDKSLYGSDVFCRILLDPRMITNGIRTQRASLPAMFNLTWLLPELQREHRPQEQAEYDPLSRPFPPGNTSYPPASTPGQNHNLHAYPPPIHPISGQFSARPPRPSQYTTRHTQRIPQHAQAVYTSSALRAPTPHRLENEAPGPRIHVRFASPPQSEHHPRPQGDESDSELEEEVDPEDDGEEIGSPQPICQKITNLRWTPEHHDWLAAYIADWIRRNKRRPSYEDHIGFTNALWEKFKGTKVLKGRPCCVARRTTPRPEPLVPAPRLSHSPFPLEQ